MGPKLAPRNQVYIPNKPANEAASPVVIRVSVTRPTIAILCWAGIWNCSPRLEFCRADNTADCAGCRAAVMWGRADGLEYHLDLHN